nr:ribonuclease H-like domain-containing protein [Candidatus Sigynarchaeota archaeon]
IADLRHGKRKSWRADAIRILSLVEMKKISMLRMEHKVRDIDLLYCISPEDIVYFDIETTGMKDATVFLVAAGRLDMKRNTMIITQFLARNHREEYAVITGFMHFLKPTDCIVSFNGKGFDVPIVDERAWYFYNMTASSKIRHHVDLLCDVKKVFHVKRTGGLARIEREMLGVKRAFDVPSHLIPSIYDRYASMGDPESLFNALSRLSGSNPPFPIVEPSCTDMIKVVWHNMVDVKSLHELLVLALDQLRRDLGHHSTTT